ELKRIRSRNHLQSKRTGSWRLRSHRKDSASRGQAVRAVLLPAWSPQCQADGDLGNRPQYGAVLRIEWRAAITGAATAACGPHRESWLMQCPRPAIYTFEQVYS